MQVYLDSDPFQTQAKTLGSVVAEVREHLSRLGEQKMIVEVRLDGRTVASSELDRLHDQPIEAQELALITANPVELARQTMLDVIEALVQMRERQKQAASLLRSDHPGAALEHVRDALTVWSQVQQSVLQSVRLLGLPLDEQKVEGRGAIELVESLSTQLKAVREALIAGDWLALADTLEYDLDEQAEMWTVLIQQLCDFIKRDRLGS